MISGRIEYLVFLVLLVVGGCGNQQTANRSLELSVSAKADSFEVVNYRIVDRRYQKSPQQGLFEAHLVDENGEVLQKIGFDLFSVPNSDGSTANKIKLVVPLLPRLYKIVFYRYDTRSGHYRLDMDNALLDWEVPSQLLKSKSK